MNQQSGPSSRTEIILGSPFHRFWSGAAGYSIKAYVGGRVPFLVNQRAHFVDDENYLVVNAGQEYQFSTPEDSSLFNLTVFLSEGDVAEAWSTVIRSDESLLEDPSPRSHFLPEFVVAPLRVVEPLKQLRLQLRSAALAGVLTAEAKRAAIAEITWHALTAQWQAMGQVNRVRAARRSTREETVRRIRRAIEFIESDISQELSLGALAACACMAKHHFLRRFKDVTGETPHQFVLRLRLAQAELLLRTTELPAAEVGRACGFADPSTFSTAFCNATGLSPLAWRLAQRSASGRTG